MMNKPKQVQMPETFVTDVLKLIYFLDDYELDKDTQDIVKCLETQINDKLEAMDKRKAFTEYKTAPEGEERERKRLEYLDKAEIRPKWRSEEEVKGM